MSRGMSMSAKASPHAAAWSLAFDEGSVDVGEDGFYHGDPPFGVQDGGLDAVRF